jgi:hypothetical protein
MLDVTDDKNCLTGKRMEWIGDRRFDRQIPSIMNSPSSSGARIRLASAGHCGQVPVACG